MRLRASAVAVVIATFFTAATAQTSLADAPYNVNILYHLSPGFSFAGTTVGIAGGQIAGAASNKAAFADATGTIVNLVMSGAPYSRSIANATDGQFQAGVGTLANGTDHALLWHGTEASVVDLHPSGSSSSGLMAVAGGYQAGYTIGADGHLHATYWHGNAASAVDLHPAGITDSMGTGVGGGQQVGYGLGGSIPMFETHALLWSDTAGSVIDLNPAGSPQSTAYGVGDGQQVGFAAYTTNHAYLWSGTAASAVDLNPSSFANSVAYGAGHGFQVGSGSMFGAEHALVWHGTAESFVDLGALLPAEYDESQAYSVDAGGDVFGYGLNGNTGDVIAVEWTPAAVPEPASLGLLSIAFTAILAHRRRKA